MDQKLMQKIMEVDEAIAAKKRNLKSEPIVEGNGNNDGNNNNNNHSHNNPQKEKELKKKLIADYKKRKMGTNDILEKLEL